MSLLLYLTSLCTLQVTVLQALSTPKTGRQFIEITNPLKSGVVNDRLPVSFVSNWPTWVLIGEKSKNKKFIKIPTGDDHDGLVEPTSVDELWQPLDLKLPQCKLAVGLHVRNGQVRHVLPAVDLSYDGNHRNRGLCSAPRAYSWMDFVAVMAGGLHACRLSLQTRKTKANDEDGDEEWTTLTELDSIEDAVNRAVQAIAEQPPAELGDGSNIIHVVCEGTIVECPKPGNEMRVLLLEDERVVGALHVRVENTAAGSDSEFLPEAYQQLFGDESLRRPAFVEMKKRMGKIES